MVIYESPKLSALGVPHAFSTRLSGVSRGPFDSLNLGNPNGCSVQDDLSAITQNYALLQAAIGIPGRTRAQVHQVHGATIAEARAGETFDIHQKADALVTTDARQVLSVRTADCVAVLMSDSAGRRVAAVHAGWRGVIERIVPLTLARFASSADVTVAVGPAIGFDAFEVGPEVLTAFETYFPAAPPVRHTPDGKGRVDLRAAVVQQLHLAGVTDDRIDLTDRCTHTHAEEFFSHRRETGVTGRLAALIGPRS